jgi:hypothetical protein
VVLAVGAGLGPAWAVPAQQQPSVPVVEVEQAEMTSEEQAALDEALDVVEELADDLEPGKDYRVYRGGEVSIMTSIHIPANQVHRGDVVCIGCDAVIEGEVTGDIVVVGGTLKLTGRAGHDVVAVLSEVELAEGVEIGHDFINVLGGLDDQGAVVGNERFNLELFPGLPNLGSAFGALGTMLVYGRLLTVVLVFVIILILAVFVPDRIRLLSEEFPINYGLALLAGLGGYLALWVVNSLLVVSLVGIPVAIVLHLVFLVLKVLGLAGVFHYFGMRIGRTVNRQMSLLGAVFLGYVVFSAILMLPHFFGFIGLIVALGLRTVFWFFFECPAIGLILVTRAGGRPRGVTGAPPAPQTATPPAVPTPPATPTAPAGPPAAPSPSG